MEGWIKLHRSILESKQFAHENHLKVWIWLLCKAAIKTRHLTIKTGKGSRVVTIERGQLIFGRHKAEQELKIDGSTIYTIIQAFVKDNCIFVEPNNQFSIISIIKFDDFQDDTRFEDFEIIEDITTEKQPISSQVAANQQPRSSHVTHNNKVNKVNKVEKVKKEQPILFRESVYFDFDLFKMQFFGIAKYEVLSLEDYHENALNWSNGKGEKRLDWIATVKNWMNRDLKNKTSTNGTAKINGSANGFTHKSERANESYREIRAADKGTGEHPYD